jgi:hypothetical protein
MGRLWPYRTGAMQNVVYELRRIPLPRTPVNKGLPLAIMLTKHTKEAPDERAGKRGGSSKR